MLWRRSASDKVGLFDPLTRYASDVEFWFRLLTEGNAYCEEEPVGFYRIHGAADSAGSWKHTSDWFLKIVKDQVSRGGVRLNGAQLLFIQMKSYLNGMARDLVYRHLG